MADNNTKTLASKRTAKVWKYNPRVDVKQFNIDNINKDNFINHLLLIKQSDITYSLFMNLFGSFNGKSFAHPYDIFEVPAGIYQYKDLKGKTLKNVKPFTTTLGIWLLNIFLLRDFGFSFLFGYINKPFNDKVMKDINQTLGYALVEDKISIETYTKFLNYTQFLMPFETVFGSNHTEEVLKFSKTVEAKKNELIKQHKAELDAGNIAVAEKIEKELINFAKEYLKDDPGLDVFLSGGGGSLGNNFKNLYIDKGMIKNPDPNAKQAFTFISSSFLNGIKADEYSTFANSLAAGPYSRAKKTEVGGYWEKLVKAATETIVVDEYGSDCGTKKYLKETLTKDNISQYMYNYVVKSDGSLEEITTDNMDKFIGKTVNMRFSAFCKSKTGICSKCAGNLFYRRKSYNVGLGCIQVCSTLKNKSMKGFHDSTIKTTEMDPITAFGVK